jgi:hypothetical protein
VKLNTSFFGFLLSPRLVRQRMKGHTPNILQRQRQHQQQRVQQQQQHQQQPPSALVPPRHGQGHAEGVEAAESWLTCYATLADLYMDNQVRGKF